MNKKIMVALDNSDYAEKLMMKALEMSKLYNAELFGVSVIDYSYFSDCDECSKYAEDTQEFWTESFKAVTDKCAKLAEDTDVYYHHEMLKGNPAEEVIKYADHLGVDFIIIGHLGKSASSSFLIGSVAQRVVSHSKCSVFIVK